VRFDPDAGASVVMRRRVEELVRGLEELEEDEGEGGDASSDLFELESLRAAPAPMSCLCTAQPASWPTTLSSPKR
jgi:hypothetical protein